MLSKEELLEIKGGSVSAALISAITNIFVKLFDFGKSVGSALRRTSSKNYCRIP